MADVKYVDWDGLVYYDGKIKTYVHENYLRMGGVVYFEDIPEPSYENLNFIYKIKDNFTTNEHFDIVGENYLKGTWIQCVDITGESNYRYIIFDEKSIGGTADVDFSDYYTKLQTEQLINDKIDSLEIPDVTKYYTKEETEGRLKDVSDDLDAELDVLNKLVIELADSVEDIEQKDYATNDQVTNIVEETIETTVVKEIETKVTTVVQEKVDAGEIEVSTTSITYGGFEED